MGDLTATCPRCGTRLSLHHERRPVADRWTPERGYGTAVTPRDTVEGLAERLREAQTVTLLEVRRRRHAERRAGEGGGDVMPAMCPRCPRCGGDILTAEERAARRASYERMLVELETARAEIARLSHELRLVRSPRMECHVTVPLASLVDRCDSADLMAQAFARREDEWRRAMEREVTP